AALVVVGWGGLGGVAILPGCGGAEAAGGPANPVAQAAFGCPADMVSLPGFCIDPYEAPNQPGAAPLPMQNALDGRAWCDARGKRLCSEAEWLRACQGPASLPYPYGTTYVQGRCVDDKTWIAPDWSVLATWPSQAAEDEAARLYQADPSGARAGCVSAEG